MNHYLHIIILIVSLLSLNGCVMRDGEIQKITLGSASIKNIEDVQEQRDNIVNKKNKAKSIKLLINAYNNKNLSQEVRMASLEALAASKDKLVLEAIQKSVRNVELLDFDLMIKSVELLAQYGNEESINALVSGLKKSESKIMDLREIIINAISNNGSDNHIITLLELYEILSVTPAPSQEWVFLRDHINKYFKKYKSEYKVYKKYIKEESKYKELAQNLEESTTSLASLKYKILGLNASDSAKKILYSKYLELEESEKRDEEFNKLKKWLNIALDLPFNNVKKFSYKKGGFTDFLKSTLKKLDDNLYGMSEIKEQILLFINSKLLNPDMKGCCLGLIGPPGTGKTSIARIIAEVLDYPFEQISFGGVTNTEFIKGHDFTYIGSQPGAIAKSLSRMKYKNGILFLDEYEKISANKDIVSTLLHITDPSQNHIFRDQYLNDITIDLSAIWFIYSMKQETYSLMVLLILNTSRNKNAKQIDKLLLQLHQT